MRVLLSFVWRNVAQGSLPSYVPHSKSRTADTNDLASSGHPNLRWTPQVSLKGASGGTEGRTTACVKNARAMEMASSSGTFVQIPPKTAMFPLALAVELEAVDDDEECADEEKRADKRRTSASILSSRAAYRFRARLSTMFVSFPRPFVISFLLSSSRRFRRSLVVDALVGVHLDVHILATLFGGHPGRRGRTYSSAEGSRRPLRARAAPARTDRPGGWRGLETETAT